MSGGGGARSGGVGGSGGGAAAAAGASSIPAKDRKVVQSLKEIVGHGEEEIYAMLRECNMDPNETVQRLMNQDTFHEVKRKGKKKEPTANSSENRSRPSGSYRGGRGDRGAGRGQSRYPPNDSGRGKSLPPKENGSHFSSAANVPSAAESAPPPKPAPSPVTGPVGSSPALANGSYYPPSIPPPQGAWSKLPGQATMADILKSNGAHISGAQQSAQHVHKEWKPKMSHPDVAVPGMSNVGSVPAEPAPLPVISEAPDTTLSTKFPGLSSREEQQTVTSNFQSQGSASNLEWKPKLGHQDAATVPGLNTVESVVTEALKSPPASVISETETVAVKFQGLSTREEQQVVMPNNFQNQGDLGLSFGSFGEPYASSLPSGFSSEDGLDISASSEGDSAAKEVMREQPSTGADTAAPDSSLINEIPVQIDPRSDTTTATLSSSFSAQSDISKLRSSSQAQQYAQQYHLQQSPSSYSTGLPQIPVSQHSFESSEDMTPVSSSTKQQHYADATTSYYSPGFRPSDGEVRFPPYLTTKYNNGAVVLPGHPLTQEAGLSSSSTASQAVASTTHTVPAAPQQPMVHAYPAQPTGMPLGHFAAYSYPYPSYTLVPSPYQHSYNTSYPQPPVSSYPSGANYAPMKYPVPYKPGSGPSNSPLSAATAGYAGYSASSMYANPAATTTISSGYEDATAQFKDSNMYLHATHPQAAERMWMQSQLSGDAAVAAAAAQTSSYYALSQNQHSSYTQPSNHTHPIAGYTSLYHGHPSQPGPATGAHQLIQPQTLSGGGAAGSTQVGSTYQQMQRMQQQQQQQQHQHQQQNNWNAYS